MPKIKSNQLRTLIFDGKCDNNNSPIQGIGLGSFLYGYGDYIKINKIKIFQLTTNKNGNIFDAIEGYFADESEDFLCRIINSLFEFNYQNNLSSWKSEYGQDENRQQLKLFIQKNLLEDDTIFYWDNYTFNFGKDIDVLDWIADHWEKILNKQYFIKLYPFSDITLPEIVKNPKSIDGLQKNLFENKFQAIKFMKELYNESENFKNGVNLDYKTSKKT